MIVEEAITIFSGYSLEEKRDFLAGLSHELTIVARDSYEAGGDGLTDPRRMRLINEVQHSLSGFLWALLRGDSQRYPDNVLVGIILEQPDDEILKRQLNEAFVRLTARYATTTRDTNEAAEVFAKG